MLKIILIDDDEIALLLERKLLHRCSFDFEILSFRGAKNALDYLCEAKNNINFLILLDINMPQISGWKFLSKLSQMKIINRVFVLMVTSSTDAFSKAAAEEYSVVIDLIEKPITMENCKKIRSYPELKKFF